MSVHGLTTPFTKPTTLIHFPCRINVAHNCVPPAEVDAVAGEHFIGWFAYRLASQHSRIQLAVAGRGAVLQRVRFLPFRAVVRWDDHTPQYFLDAWQSMGAHATLTVLLGGRGR